MNAPIVPRPGNGAIAWHSLDTSAVFSLLVADPLLGLTNRAAADRRSLRRKTVPRIAPPKRFFLGRRQTVVALLLSSLAIVTALLRLWIDCLTLVALLFLNLLPPCLSERRARAAATALRVLRKRRVLALRDAHLQDLPVSKLVPGDIIIVVEGDIVPADARLLNARSLWCSARPVCHGPFPLPKVPGTLAADTSLRRRSNMIHMGTRVIHGSGRAIVVATGSAATIFQSAKSAHCPGESSHSLAIDQPLHLPVASKQ